MTTTPQTADLSEDPAPVPSTEGTQSFTALVHIKPGRREQLQQVLATVAARIAAGERGPLDEIGTVHFARWVILPDYGDEGGLLFASDYDGSWDEYIEDFAKKATESFQLIYDNCVGWPEGGATDIPAFKEYIKTHELTPEVYYRAYPRATVRQVNSAVQLKRRLLDVFDAASE